MRFNAEYLTDTSLLIHVVVKSVKVTLKAGFVDHTVAHGPTTISLLLRASFCFAGSNRPQGLYRSRQTLLK